MQDMVREALDLPAFFGVCKAEQGQPPYRPGLLGALLLHGYGHSRIMPSQGGFIAGYSGQIAMDTAH